MDMLSELCLPFVKVGGLFIAMKSIESGAEIVDAYRAIRLIGGSYTRTIQYTLDEGLEHTLVVITKIQPTGDKYPRSFAQIKARPL
jgi:16S rRNA (guanine527-N7)-methyltransferase